SPVKQTAAAAGLPVFQPRTLRDEQAQRVIAEAGADAMIVAAYGLILPSPVLAAPRLGCLNIHASLLPRWRGAAPIQRAIEAGDAETGITIMQMDEGLDTGPMLLREALPIGPDDNAAVVHDRLAELGGRLIVRALADAQAGRLAPVAQPEQGVTYAAKLDKAEGVIDWRLPAVRLADRIRAFDPFPGCVATCQPGPPLKIWQAKPVVDPQALADAIAAARAQGRPIGPGATLRRTDRDWWVACGDGALALQVVQRPGGKRLAVRQLLQGLKLSEYCQFDGEGAMDAAG
ncbi:MAG: methionyl-tRNA formyltransferase, partial [Burkholderiaceae bacterium]